MAEPNADDVAMVAAAFDADFYRARNPDIEEAGLDPLQHFLSGGWREGRDPTPDFSVRAYLDANEDVALLGLNPFLHWLTHGRDEGRPLKLELGFRHAILHRAVRLEDRLELERGHDLPGASAAKLAAALKGLGERLFITVSHDAYVDRVGGVQLCIQREAAAAQDGWSRLHLYPAIPALVTDFETVDPVVGLIVDGQKKGLFSAARLAEALSGRPPPREVRFAVHSFLGHSVEVVSAVLDAVGARTGFLWLHDQSSLCAGYTLLRNDIAFCGAPPVDSMACGVCIYGLRRRVQVAEHAAFLERFEVTVLSPSQAQLDLWRHGAPYRAVEARVHPHAALLPAGAAAPAGAGPLKLAFLGFAADHKGWPIFERLARDFEGDDRYAFLHLGGGAPEPGPWATVPISPDGRDGPAMVDAVRDLGVDVALILSICPETFSFTAHEAVAGGAAVVALTDSSAVARLAADPKIGRVARDEDDLRALFDSGALAALARSLRKPQLYDLVYSRVTADFLPGAAA